MAFLEAANGRRLGIHIEVKMEGESLLFGQAESYPLRAACWTDPARKPTKVPRHDDWLTVIFCPSTLLDPRLKFFDKVITHPEARKVIPAYPR